MGEKEEKRKHGKPETQIGATFEPDEAREIRHLKDDNNCTMKQAVDMYYAKKYKNQNPAMGSVEVKKVEPVRIEEPVRKPVERDLELEREKIKKELLAELDKRFPKVDPVREPARAPDVKTDAIDQAERIAKMLRDERESALKEGKGKEEADKRMVELASQIDKKLDGMKSESKPAVGITAAEIGEIIDKKIKGIEPKVPAGDNGGKTSYEKEYNDAIHTELMKKITGQVKSGFDAEMVGAIGTVASSISEDVTRFMEKNSAKGALQADAMAVGMLAQNLKQSGLLKDSKELIELVRLLKGQGSTQEAPEPAKRKKVDEVLDDMEKEIREENKAKRGPLVSVDGV